VINISKHGSIHNGHHNEPSSLGIYGALVLVMVAVMDATVF